MSVQLHAFTCGWLTIPRAFMLAGEEGVIKVPIPSYLVTHPKGRVLFDTGLHAATLDDPTAHVGEMLARYHEFDFCPGEEIGARLAAFGVEPGDIVMVINSHLHFDHCGGNAQLPNADIVIQRRELEHARAVDGEYDVFGDGSVVCLPTHGHTPGHQSLRVQTEQGGEFVLCGDACYLRDSLEKLRLPGVIADPEGALAVFHRLREMQARGARIMYGHDPEFWTSVPQAPVRLG